MGWPKQLNYKKVTRIMKRPRPTVAQIDKLSDENVEYQKTIERLEDELGSALADLDRYRDKAEKEIEGLKHERDSLKKEANRLAILGDEKKKAEAVEAEKNKKEALLRENLLRAERDLARAELAQARYDLEIQKTKGLFGASGLFGSLGASAGLIAAMVAGSAIWWALGGGSRLRDSVAKNSAPVTDTAAAMAAQASTSVYASPGTG
jgi:multidrug resistance efflux pump